MSSGQNIYSEDQVIARLREIFSSNDPRITVGIGDDAAVVQGSTCQIITTDMAVQNVHFRQDWSSAFEIGRKATAANTADILAMSGKSDFLLVALCLTGSESFEWIEQLAQGIKFEADLAGATVVGGDLTRGAQIVISITAMGSSQKPILRSGAQIGDCIYISSLCGWSAAGLNILKNSESITTSEQERAVSEFRNPTIDYNFDTSKASALCDVSDALIVQAKQLALASQVEFHFDLNKINANEEFAALTVVAELARIDIWEWIFCGGEDHVLLATGKGLNGICIGEVLSGSGVTGQPIDLKSGTWRHFA